MTHDVQSARAALHGQHVADLVGFDQDSLNAMQVLCTEMLTQISPLKHWNSSGQAPGAELWDAADEGELPANV